MKATGIHCDAANKCLSLADFSPLSILLLFDIFMNAHKLLWHQSSILLCRESGDCDWLELSNNQRINNTRSLNGPRRDSTIKPIYELTTAVSRVNNLKTLTWRENTC